MSESKKLNLKALRQPKNSIQTDIGEEKNTTQDTPKDKSKILEQNKNQTNQINQETNKDNTKQIETKQKFLVSLDDIKTMKEKDSKKKKKESGEKKEEPDKKQNEEPLIKQETRNNNNNFENKKRKNEYTLFKNYSIDTEEKEIEENINNEKKEEKNKKEIHKSSKKRLFISLALLGVLSLGVFYIIGYKKMDFNTIKSSILGADTKKIETNTGVTKKNDEKTREEIIKEKIRQFLLKNYKK